MSRGAKRGSTQTIEHIAKRVASRTKWNGGHNLMTTESFLDKLLQGWPECPYDLSKVDYIKNDVKVTLVCSTHGNFLKWPSDVLNHSGCPMCSGFGFTSQEYVADLADRFPEYDFSQSIYVNALTNMTIVCNKHGPFNLSRNGLTNGAGCRDCTKEQTLLNRIAAGRARDPNSLTDYEKYKKAVWKETAKSYKKYKPILGERSRTRHLDHIYSILHGFRDSFDPLILGNIVNLRIIDSNMNQSKSMNSDFTKEELMKLYEDKQ